RFSNLDKKKIDLSYKVKKEIPESCLKQIRGLPIEGLINMQKESSFEKYVFPMLIIGAIISLGIYIQKFTKDPKLSDEKNEKKKDNKIAGNVDAKPVQDDLFLGKPIADKPAKSKPVQEEDFMEGVVHQYLGELAEKKITKKADAFVYLAEKDTLSKESIERILEEGKFK
ncbi:MAG: hypothetical protein HGA85_09035, partial [Nanoarchaeota archaeon]|nr:hypothetical protein [Nanoarchaeota archaeon]